MFDVKLALLDLANRPGREAEARDRLRELISDNEKRPEPHVALGYIEARDGHRAEAGESLLKTLWHWASRNPQMLWDYGRMVGESNPPQTILALTTLLADQSDRIDVRLDVWAQIQMNGKLAKEAIETLGPVKKVTPKDAPRFFQILVSPIWKWGTRKLRAPMCSAGLKTRKNPTRTPKPTGCSTIWR